MEENLRNQLESTFSTCRRSPRIIDRHMKETPSTVKKQFFRNHNTIDNEEDNKESLSIGHSPEGN